MAWGVLSWSCLLGFMCASCTLIAVSCPRFGNFLPWLHWKYFLHLWPGLHLLLYRWFEVRSFTVSQCHTSSISGYFRFDIVFYWELLCPKLLCRIWCSLFHLLHFLLASFFEVFVVFLFAYFESWSFQVLFRLTFLWRFYVFICV